MHTDLTLERNGETQIIELIDNTHLFHRDLTNLYLEQYVDKDGVPYTFDDITHIYTSYYTPNSVDILPAQLNKLQMTKTNLSIFPVLPISIEHVNIHQSMLREIPDMTNYINLKFLRISECMITKAFIPPKLNENTRATIFSYQGSKPFIYYDDLDPTVPVNNTRPDIEYDPYDPTVPVNNIRPVIEYDPYDPVPVHLTDDTTPLNGSQTVHLHSINQSVIKSYEKLKAYAIKYELTKIDDPLFELFNAVEPTDPLYKNTGRTCKQRCQNAWNYFIKNINPYQLLFRETLVKSWMRSWCNIDDKHTILCLSFYDLLELVVRVAKHHPQRADIYGRIKIEMTDAIGMCFTGRMNRLMNALVGFDDLDVQIGLSVREQVTMEIQSLVKRVTQHPDQFDKIMEELKTLLEQQSIHEFPRDLRKSYLDAMEDYRP